MKPTILILYDCIGVKIHPVDRTNTDTKVLPCLIIEKIEQDEQVKFKLVCEYGKLDHFYSLEHLIDLKMTCSGEFKNNVVDNLKNITFIETCKLYVRASTTRQTCDCKSKYRTKQCGCRKMIVFVLPNVIQNEVLVKICMNSSNDYFCEIFL